MMTMQDEKCDSLKKERILEETLKLISEEGFDNVTIRKIAKRANVNVALINYHFGSKNKLLNIALKKILSVLMETISLLENEKVDPLGRLRSFFFQYVKVFYAYPSIYFILFQKSTFEFESRKEYIDFIKTLGVQRLVTTIKEITGESDEERCMVMISHLLGGTFLPLIMEPILKDATPFRVPDAEKHIDLLFKHYFYRYLDQSK